MSFVTIGIDMENFINKEILVKLMPRARTDIVDAMDYMSAVIIERYSINTKLRWAHFIAQTSHESGHFTTIQENLNYRNTALTAMFGSRITVEQANKYGRIEEATTRKILQAANQAEIANIIYGGEWGKKNLGNDQPGDGSRFIGRGLIQLTGKSNYTQFAKFKDQSVEKIIEYLKTPWGAVESAAWFWLSRNLNQHADKDDVVTITRIINGGYNHLTERRKLLSESKKILQI